MTVRDVRLVRRDFDAAEACVQQQESPLPDARLKPSKPSAKPRLKTTAALFALQVLAPMLRRDVKHRRRSYGVADRPTPFVHSAFSLCVLWPNCSSEHTVDKSRRFDVLGARPLRPLTYVKSDRLPFSERIKLH